MSLTVGGRDEYVRACRRVGVWAWGRSGVEYAGYNESE
jgi:hypothetical protein